MAERTVVIIGATGSIGTQTLDVLKRLKDFKLVGFTYHTNGELAERIAKEFNVKDFVSTFEDPEEAVRLVENKKPDITLVAVPGFVSLRITLGVIPNTKRIALASKEALVCGGWLVRERLKKFKTELVPVDSEHSAIFRIFDENVTRIALTASGGALRDWNVEDIKDATIDDVLSHPVWRMGKRVTVDSATMVNKVFEVFEAMEIFDLSRDAIDVFMHREGIVHGMVYLKDGTVKMNAFKADMRIPIAYSLTHPDVVLDFQEPKLSILTFEDVDLERYPLFSKSFEIHDSYALRTAFNAADEVAVEAFLKGKIKFWDIVEIVERTLSMFEKGEPRDLKDLEEIDERAREIAGDMV